MLLAEIRDLFTRGFEAVCTFALVFNRFFKQDRWSDAYDKGRSRVPIITEHLEFKPQLKGRDGEEQAVATANRSSYLSASPVAILYLRTRRSAKRCLNIA